MGVFVGEPGPTVLVGVEVGVTLMPPRPGPFQLGFTRGYLSSQAYAEQFHNDPIAPKKPTFVSVAAGR